MPIVICKHGFYSMDTKDSRYYFREIDFYAGANAKDCLSLSLKKRIKDDKFVLFKWNHNGHYDEVFESKDLQETLNTANAYWDDLGTFAILNQGLKIAGYDNSELVNRGKRKPDVSCEHKRPNYDDMFCPRIYRRDKEELKKLIELRTDARKENNWSK